jgi:spore cortex biosynthesis protein YabQ
VLCRLKGNEEKECNGKVIWLMEEFVKNQASTMLDSLYIGMVIMALYDICRLFRRIIPHKRLLRDLEDIIFFAIAGFMVFSLVYSRNSGSVRGYIIIGVLMGMYIYYRSFGQFLVKFLGKYINKIINNILKKPIRKAIMSIRLIFGRIVAVYAKKLCKKEEKP